MIETSSKWKFDSKVDICTSKRNDFEVKKDELKISARLFKDDIESKNVKNFTSYAKLILKKDCKTTEKQQQDQDKTKIGTSFKVEETVL